MDLNQRALDDCILFGNGFNRLNSNNPSWTDLLKESSKFGELITDVPPTSQYESAYLQFAQKQIKDSSVTREFDFKQQMANRLREIQSSELTVQLRDCGVRLFLTPNFDYAFYNCGDNDPQFVARDNSEKVYSIHRWHEYNINGQNIVVYPYHGEIQYPQTIELGYDHYCGAIGKIDSYIKGHYTFNSLSKNPIPSISKRLKDKSLCQLGDFSSNSRQVFPNILSWIDAFFFTNLHIIGFGLDFAEIDVWWILNRRARLLIDGKISNDIYYYHTGPNTDAGTISKLQLLEEYGVRVSRVDDIPKNDSGEIDYAAIYTTQMNNLKSNLTL